MLNISYHLGSILFDSSAFYSFVFNMFSMSLPIDIDYVAPALTIMIPFGDFLSTNRKCVEDIIIHSR